MGSKIKKNASGKDYASTLWQMVFLALAIVIVLVRQYFWKMLNSLSKRAKTIEQENVKKAVEPIIRRSLTTMSYSLPENTGDKSVYSPEELQEKMEMTQEALNGCARYHEVVANFFMAVNAFWKRHIEYEVPLSELQQGTYVFMSNHTSFADSFYIAGTGIYSATVAKNEVTQYPIAGQAFKNTGLLTVHFVKDPETGRWTTDKKKTKEMLQRATDYLRCGLSIVMFPEGTIPVEDELDEFKPGFFNVAKDAGVGIAPVALWGLSDVWPMAAKGVPRVPMGAGDGYVKYGRPMQFLTADEVKMLNDPEQIYELMENKYEMPFNAEWVAKNPVLNEKVEAVCAMNQQEKNEGPEYENKVQQVFMETVREKVYRMRCELQQKQIDARNPDLTLSFENAATKLDD